MHRIVASIILALSAGSGAGQDSQVPKGSFRQLRFSPDGRYVLAQNDSEVTLLTVEPFTILFRIPAQNATAALFTPDSRNVVFVSSAIHRDPQKILLEKSGAHVERWSIADRTRVESATLPMLVCGTEELSPDGGVLACVDYDGTIRLVEVPSGRTIFEKRHFTKSIFYSPPEEFPAIPIGDLGSAGIEFSPDSRFLVATAARASPIVWNLHEQTVVKLTGELKALKHGCCLLFAFIAPDRVMMTRSWWGKHGVWIARVAAFPSGKLQSTAKIPKGHFIRATDSRFVLTRPFGAHTPFDDPVQRAAATELSTGEVIISDGALDVFGEHFVAERVNGREVGLYERHKGLKATVVLHQK